MDVKEIAQELARQAESVCHRLLPGGRRIGREWVAADTTGVKGSSLSVCLEGNKAGVWADFATNEKGDLIDLWRLTQRVDLPTAIREIKHYLGIQEKRFHPQPRKTYTRPQKPNCQAPKEDVLRYLTQDRKLTKETLEAFKIAENGREIVFPFLRNDDLIAVKYLGIDRPDGKKQIRFSQNAEPCLFGWQALDPNTRTVVICEGELDALSLHQYGYSALSIPFGAGNHQWVENEWDSLERFSEIYLCFDDDNAGKKGVFEVAQRLGLHRCKLLELPAKDANECLQLGINHEAIRLCVEGASHLDPDELKPAGAFLNATYELFYPSNSVNAGRMLPWLTSQDKFRIRPNELTIWTGINGHGKSQVLGHVVIDLMRQGERACVASLETKPARLLYRIVRQVTTCQEPSQEFFQSAFDWLGEKLWLFDVTGTAKTDQIIEIFKYARRRYGITQFVIDSLMKCGINEDDYREQKAFVEQLCDFKNEFDCHVHLVAHSRKGESERSVPGKLDVKGTGSITDLADNVFSVWRNKNKEIGSSNTTENEQESEQPDAVLYCSKQRNGDWEGRIPLLFDRVSYQYYESGHRRPKAYVNWPERTENNEQYSHTA